MAFDYAPIRKRLLPDLAEGMKALDAAQRVDDRARDVRPLMATLERLVVADPELGGHIRARTAALLSWPWRIVAITPEHEQRAEQCRAEMEEAIDEVLDRYLDAELYGQSLSKIDWLLEAGRWVPNAVEHFDASDIERMPKNKDYPGGVAILETSATGYLRTPATPTIGGGLATTYVAGLRGTAIGGALRIVLILMLLININMQDWTNFNRILKGLKLAKHRAGADPEDVATARLALEQLGTTGGAVVSDDILFEFITMASYLGATSYKDFIEAAINRIRVLLRGNASTTQLPDHGGSRAAISALQLVEQDILFMDIRWVARVINRQLLKQWWSLNVEKVERRSLPMRFEFITDEIEDTEKNARTLETLGRSGWQAEEEEVRRRTGWETLTAKPVTPGLF